MVQPNAGRRTTLNLLATGSLHELSMGGDPISLNQRVQGSSPCAPAIEYSDLISELGGDDMLRESAERRADP